MKDVIQELERRRNRYAEFAYDPTILQISREYDEIISLLKGAKE
jgi:hypothetical protein